MSSRLGKDSKVSCNSAHGTACSISTVLLQGFLFAFVGMCAGMTGTAISNGLLLLRQKLDPSFKSQNEAPNVPLNAATWAAHMGISSNVRYQILNGLDMVSSNIKSKTEFVSFCNVVTFRLKHSVLTYMQTPCLHVTSMYKMCS